MVGPCAVFAVLHKDGTRPNRDRCLRGTSYRSMPSFTVWIDFNAESTVASPV